MIEEGAEGAGVVGGGGEAEVNEGFGLSCGVEDGGGGGAVGEEELGRAEGGEGNGEREVVVEEKSEGEESGAGVGGDFGFEVGAGGFEDEGFDFGMRGGEGSGEGGPDAVAVEDDLGGSLGGREVGESMGGVFGHGLLAGTE